MDAARQLHADPHALAARGLELSGLEYVHAIFAGELPPPPIAVLMGFRGVEATRRVRSSSRWSLGRSTTTRSAPCTAASR